MTRLIDLHTHSTASDGSMSPAELVRYARLKGLAAIALTDHDTIEGLKEALSETEKAGVEVVPGVEISADFDPEMHILGYFTPSAYANIEGTLAALRKNREERNPKIIRRLNELGFEITMDDIRRESPGGVLGRAHIARIMHSKGYVGSMQEAFDKYLSSGRPAYFKKDKLTPEQCIAAISNSGGISVLAHPIYLNMDFDSLDRLLSRLVKAGLAGIEAYYVDNSPDDTKHLLELSIKHRLLITGGSDFHGGYKADIDIGTGRGGLLIPYGLLEELKKRLKDA